MVPLTTILALSSSTTCTSSHPTTEDVEMKDAGPASTTAPLLESTSKEEPQTSHTSLKHISSKE